MREELRPLQQLGPCFCRAVVGSGCAAVVAQAGGRAGLRNARVQSPPQGWMRIQLRRMRLCVRMGLDHEVLPHLVGGLRDPSKPSRLAASHTENALFSPSAFVAEMSSSIAKPVRISNPQLPALRVSSTPAPPPSDSRNSAGSGSTAP